MKMKCALLIATLGLAGCSLVQGMYDAEAIDACRELPTVDERLACERAAEDAARARRQDKPSSKTESK